MPMIHETVVTTMSQRGEPHIAPMGVRLEGNQVVLMPFKPSRTYDNVLGNESAVVNFTTDVRVFAGCVTGRKAWPCVAATEILGVRLAGALAHAELRLDEHIRDDVRPVLRMRRVHEETHGPFSGFNRAQAAVIEGAVLVSRLHMLPRAKIDDEMAYLQIAIDKTAGPDELEAWQWLRDAVATHHAGGEREAR
jgi:uncharacterized protein